MPTVGELFINLGLNTASFTRNLERTKNLAFGNLKEMGRSFGLVGRAVAGIGVAAAGAFAFLAKGQLESMDNFAKLSQRTGVAVELLSGYAHGAKLSGIETSDLAAAFAQLSKRMFDAAGGSKEQIRAFQGLGVEFRDARGNLRPLDAMLGDIAERFSKMPDGAQKSALAMEVFGKSGAALIPFLNQGRSGLEEARKEAARLGLVIGGDTAKAAEEFNDNLSRMGGLLRGVAAKELAGILPLLGDATNAFLGIAGAADEAAITIGQRFAAGVLGGAVALRAWKLQFGPGGIAPKLDMQQFEREMAGIADLIFGPRSPLTAPLNVKPPKLPKPDAKDIKPWKELTNVWQMAADAALRLQEEIGGPSLARGGGLFRTGILSPEFLDDIGKNLPLLVKQFGESFNELKPAKGVVNQLAGALEDLGRRMFSAFTDVLIHGRGALDFLKLLLIEFTKFIIGYTVFKPIIDSLKKSSGGQGFGGAFAGFLSGLFGGFFQHGGMAPLGRVSVVGEAGPEPIIPTPSGAIVMPHSSLAMAGGGVTVQQFFDFRGADGSAEPKLRRAARALKEEATAEAIAAIRERARRTV